MKIPHFYIPIKIWDWKIFECKTAVNEDYEYQSFKETPVN